MPTSTANDPRVPQNLEAERALLGSILLDNEALKIARNGADVRAFDFFSAGHQLIFEKMETMAKDSRAIDIITLCDALTQDGSLERAGGAVYLSALTDGVPIGAAPAVHEYCRIIKEKAMRREELKRAYELAEQVKLGAAGEDLAEQAKKIIQARPAKPAAAGKNRYPEMPKEAWHPAAEMYRQAVSEASEASDTYHLACFLTVVGALLGRTVFVRKGRTTYPNLFTVLVGRSGARKGTAMDYATRLLEAIDARVYLLDSIDSKESSVKELAQHQAELYGERWTHEHREILAMEEFGSLIDKAGQKATSNIMKYLCRLYDCPRHEANKAETSKAEVKQPTMSVMSATSESYLEPLTLRDIQGGVGNRVNWVGADPKARKDDPPDPNQDVLDQLAQMIRNRVDWYREKETTRFQLSPAATKRHKTFYEKEYNPHTGDEMMEVLGERDAQTCLKVAMIYAALDKSNDFIELHHLEAAISYVGFLYTTRIPIFSGHGLSQASAAQQRIIEIIDREGVIPLSRLQPLMRRHCDATLLEKYLRSLTYAGGPIRLINSGRKLLVARGE